MNYEEYKAAKEAILNDSDRVKVNTFGMLNDESGSQEILGKTEIKSVNGTYTQEFQYAGDTRNWSLQGIVEYLTIGEERIDEVKE